MYKHVLVTGGAGFVGSALCVAVKEDFPQSQVTAFDNLRRRGSELNLAGLRRHGVHFAHGDIRVPGDLNSIRPLPDLIIDCSAEPSVLSGYSDSPDYLLNTNLTGCYHCLEVARRSR